jgi:DNA repair protein RadD
VTVSFVDCGPKKAANKGDIVARAVREAVEIICAERRCHIVFFCVDVAHCHAVSAELAKYGILAPAVTGKTKAEERTKIGEDFKHGRIHAICNVNVYTEGFNATCVDCIVLLRPTLSPGLFSQMVGRGLRLHENKRDCLVLDFAGCIDEHGPIDLLGGRPTVMAVCGQCRESFSRAIKKCPQCGWVIPKIEMEQMEAVESERRMHGEKVSTKSILSSAPSIHTVNSVHVSRHKKDGKPDSLLVRYVCGLEVFREWICLDHEGYAGTSGQTWWRQRFGPQKVKPTVNSALESLFIEQYLNDWTKTVTVKREGKYKRIIGYNQQP